MSRSGDPGVEQAWVTEAGGGSHGVSKADLPAPAEHLSQLETSQDPRIAAAHEVLAALLHTSVANDRQSGPDGFLDARNLGLIEGANRRLTPAGRAVLVLLGVRDG